MGDLPPPPTPPDGSGGRASPAGLGVRVAARLLDAVIVGLPAGAVLALAGLPVPALALAGLESWTLAAAASLVGLAYHVTFESLGGATPGKLVVGLRVAAEHGEVPGLVAATSRNLWLLVGLVPWVGGLVLLIVALVIAMSVSRHPHHLGRHDEIAGTSVHVVATARS